MHLSSSPYSATTPVLRSAYERASTRLVRPSLSCCASLRAGLIRCTPGLTLPPTFLARKGYASCQIVSRAEEAHSNPALRSTVPDTCLPALRERHRRSAALRLDRRVPNLPHLCISTHVRFLSPPRSVRAMTCRAESQRSVPGMYASSASSPHFCRAHSSIHDARNAVRDTGGAPHPVGGAESFVTGWVEEVEMH